MKKKTYCLLIIMFFAAIHAMASDTGWPDVTSESKPWTRWWWLGSAVDKDNLTYNISALGKAGLGGVEITPIYGVKGNDANNISYLTPRWIEMLAHTETEARNSGMKVDMNTGTGWPFGGPEVTVEDAATKAIFQEYPAKGGENVTLKITVDEARQKKAAYLSRLMAYSDKGKKLDLTNLVSKDGDFSWKAPKGEWKLIALFVGKTFQEVKRSAPGGHGYVMDHFSKSAVRNYLNKYDKAFARENTPFPSSFFNDSYEVYNADWTPALLEEFEKRRGYKLENYLRELLAKGKTDISCRVVSDYRETLGEMLLTDFTEQWTSWAHSHGATTRNQAHGSPANIIDLYAAVDIPECEIFGITDFDIPGLRKDEMRKINDGDPVTLKMASSAAHITGKKFTSSETFTWLTEHFRTSLSQCKTEIDQVFTSGVNHVFFHGTPYSPKEAPWPGWLFYASVNMSPTNSIWKDAPAFYSYITRVQSFLQYGEPDNDLLVYFPVYDIWYEQQSNYYFAFGIHGLRGRLPKFYKTVEKIRESGRDVDYISDKYIMSATVENGLIKTTGGATYKALVLPATRFMPPETLEKLSQLAREGAKIIFTEHYPENVPGLKDYRKRENRMKKMINTLPEANFAQSEVSKWGNGNIITGKDFNEILTMSGIYSESFSQSFKGQYIRRKNETGYHYFFTLLTNNPVKNWVPLAVHAQSALFFDPMTGTSGKAKIRTANNTTEVYMELEPGQSIILKTFTDKNVEAENWHYFTPDGQKMILSDNWEITFKESEPAIPGVFKTGKLISWTELANENATKNRGTARYSTRFTWNDLSADEYRLSLGDVRESARVYLNGNEVATLFAVPFRTNIGKYLKQGENLLEVEVTNLPANSISDYDRRGVEWRIFNEINFVDLNYKKTLYDNWETAPSGLLGPVEIYEVEPNHAGLLD
ncbi:MAG: glycosyl hydrolase [Paludibacteraceae bacterium]